MKTCASERLSPTTGPIRSRRRTRRRSSAGWNSGVGESSSAMPVKCFETSASESRRTPNAGSWTTAPRASADLQHHEVVQVPVQDAGRAQLRELLELEPQRPRRELQRARDLHQVGERRALERDGEAPPQPGEVDAMAMEAGDHAEAREPALGRLGLQEHRAAAGARRTAARRGTPSRPAGEAQQRLEDPLDQPAPVEQDVGFDLHAGLQAARCRP